MVSAWAGPAGAAAGQPVPSVAIDLIVQAIAPTVLQVTLAYTCQPEPTTLGSVGVAVTQAVPLPAQGSGDADLVCDGGNHTVVVTVFGGPAFAAGPALASAQACTSLTCGTDARKVTIVAAPLPLAAHNKP